MSNRGPAPSLIVEWAPDESIVYDPIAKTRNRYSTLMEATAQYGTGRVVRLAVSRRSSFVRSINVPDAAKSDVMQALRLTASSHLPLPASEAAFDVRLTGEVGVEGRVAVLAAMRSEDLKALQNDLRSTGWKESEILPAAFGSLLLAQRAGLQDCMVVQKSDEGWTLDVVCRNELRYSRTLSSSVPAKSIEDEIARTYAAAGIQCGPVLAAGGLTLQIAEIQTEYTSLECLATPQAEALSIHLELIDDILARLAKRRKERMIVAGASLAVAAVISGFVYASFAGAQARVDQEKALWLKSDRNIAVQKNASETQALAAKAMSADITHAFLPAQKTSDVLSLISTDTVAGVWLTGIGIERGKAVAIRGTSTSSDAVASYVRALSSEARFRDVELVFANNGLIEQHPVVQFSVTGDAIGNLPLIDYSKVRNK